MENILIKQKLRGENLLIVYGISGVGKTTICNFLKNHSFDFISLGNHPSFRIVPIPQIVNEYILTNKPKNLCFEGCFPKRSYRNFLVESLNKVITFKKILFCYLSLSPEHLANRRNRNANEYKALLKDFEIGDPKYDHLIIDTDNLNPTEIIKLILDGFEK